jgi:hypothetical protein
LIVCKIQFKDINNPFDNMGTVYDLVTV